MGDRVMAYDEVNKVFTPSIVNRTYAHQASEYLVINGVMRITPNHQVITPEGDWVPIADLAIGDEMVGPDGLPVRITSTESVTTDVPVYNLEIDVYQTYIADGVVVHNAKGKVPAL